MVYVNAARVKALGMRVIAFDSAPTDSGKVYAADLDVVSSEPIKGNK